LWDMHTHLSFYGAEALSMVVRNGVLAVRDLGGSLEELDRWRAEIDRGTRVGPRIFRAGPYIDGPKEMEALRKATTIIVTTPGEMTDDYAMNLFRRFARNGTTYDPTLVGYRTFMQEAVDLAPKDPRYVRAAAGRTKMFNRFVELVGLMKRAGVNVVTGTDFGI